MTQAETILKQPPAHMLLCAKHTKKYSIIWPPVFDLN